MIFKSNGDNDDLFDEPYFQFELLLSGRASISNKIVYYSEKFVNEACWIDIEKDTECNLYSMFYHKVHSYVSYGDCNHLVFFYSYQTLYGYNKNITDLLQSHDDSLRELGYELFKKDLYKEFRKYFIPKFRNIKTQ